MVGRDDVGPVWAVLGCFYGLCGRSWVALGASVGGLVLLLGLRRWSWAALGAYVGGLGLLLGLLLAVLGRSWGLCWRSWVAPGAL